VYFGEIVGANDIQDDKWWKFQEFSAFFHQLFCALQI
jgi:hypothetical protein